MNALLAWHFLQENRRLRYGTREVVKTGQTYRAEGPLVLCENGLHGSRKVLDALQYAAGPVICRVRLSGEIIAGTDKHVARKRKVIWMANATAILHEFALTCANRALGLLKARGDFVDPRLHIALTVKRRWLAGNATENELAAASAAASAAAKATTCEAIRATAWATTKATTWDAIRATAWATAWATASAAASAAACEAACDVVTWATTWDAVRVAQNDALTQMMESLK